MQARKMCRRIRLWLRRLFSCTLHVYNNSKFDNVIIVIILCVYIWILYSRKNRTVRDHNNKCIYYVQTTKTYFVIETRKCIPKL